MNKKAITLGLLLTALVSIALLTLVTADTMVEDTTSSTTGTCDGTGPHYNGTGHHYTRGDAPMDGTGHHYQHHGSGNNTAMNNTQCPNS